MKPTAPSLGKAIRQAAKALLVPAASALMAGSAIAGYIVDTGPGPQDVDPTIAPSARYASDQFLAANFEVPSTATITGVEGWMSVVPGGSGLGTVTLYADAGGAPGTRLFGDTFFAPVTDWGEPLYSHAQWLGHLTLDWSVASGSYWIAFEAAPGGVVGGFLLSAPGQLDAEAYSQGAAHHWIRNDGLGLGIRIQAELPEPGTFALTMLGLSVLCHALRTRGRGCSPK